MRFVSSLMVVVALVSGQARAEDVKLNYEQAQLQPDGTLVAHPELAQTLSTEDLKAGLKELESYDVEQHETPVSEKVAQLLYTAEDKSAEIINGLTVNELIAANSFRPLADCSEDAISQRTEIYYRSIPKMFGVSGVSGTSLSAVTFYSLKCLMVSTNYCLKHRNEIVKDGVASDKFMNNLHRSYSGSVAVHKRLCAEYKSWCKF